MSREKSQKDNRNDSKSSRNHNYLIKLRGISNSLIKDDIKKFLHPCRIDTIHLFNNHGNSSDECLVDLETEIDVKNALKKTNQLVKNKYIEIVRSNVHEYNFFIKHKGMISWCDPVIRMNGLPFSCTMADIQNFFKDIAIARNGIYITRDMTDNALGGGYVACVSMDDAYKAIDIYHRKHIQHRYIDLSPSTYDEAKKTIINDADFNGKQFAGEDKYEANHANQRKNNQKQRSSRSNSRKNDHYSRSVKYRRSSSHSPRPSKRHSHESNRRSRSRSPVRHSSRTSIQTREYLVKMRGMPFSVVEDDVRKFFPLSCQPERIEIQCDRRTKRPNGDAHVYFKTMDEVNEARKCDRKYMNNRYVEVYFDSHRRLSPDHYPDKSNHSSSYHSSCSPEKSKFDDHSRSRSESQTESIHNQM